MKTLLLYLMTTLLFLQTMGKENPKIPKPQKNHENSLMFGMAQYRPYNINSFNKWGLPIMTFKYSRQVYKKWGININYSYWKTKVNLQRPHPPKFTYLSVLDTNTKPGDRFSTINVDYFDLELNHKIKYDKHELNFFCGPTLFTYDDAKISNYDYIILPNGLIHVSLVETQEDNNKVAIGGIAGLSYSFNFWKEGIKLGYEI